MKYLTVLFGMIISCQSFIIHNSHLRNININMNMGYVPDGLSENEWKKIKEKEYKENKNKNYSKNGLNGFKSRSLKSFQTDLEKGNNVKNFPVFNAEDKLKKGVIKKSDIPYMQRKNGNWDNSDLSRFNIFKKR